VNGLLAQYAGMRHVELRRVKWLAESLQGRTQPAPAEKLATDRCSVAVHLHSSFTDWLSEALAILNICWSKSMTAQTPVEKAS
jgi:lipopolysaccharide biosynthesis protein